MNFTIQIEDREYLQWTVANQGAQLVFARPGPVGLSNTLSDTLPLPLPETLPNTFHPLQYKLFHGDSFHFNKTNEMTLLHSPLRELGKIFPGVLIIADGKTYGRTENKKRLLYKCIPNNRNLPAFLVPYDIKLELSKHITNKYVLFKYVHWHNKHPLGELTETIGSVDIYDAFEKYQLCCKGLNTSMSKYTNYIKTKFSETDESTAIHSITHKYQTEDRTSEYIFSIDNDTTTDYDDAMSITENQDGSTRISVYIANVLVWLQEMDGWTNYGDRVSTIYLPTRKIPMLPPDLSENLCSLIEKRERFAIAMDYVVCKDGSPIISFKHTKIIVKKNYRYESANLLRNPRYKTLLDITRRLDQNITDSHEVVAYWMIKMNQEIGTFLYKHKVGIFRLAKGYVSESKSSEPLVESKMLDIDTERMLYNFNNHICSEYSAFKEGKKNTHSVMLMENYVHFTSPIRRLVDLLNQIYLWPLLGYIQTKEMVDFVERWTSSPKMCYINDTMKAIRKTQTYCELVHMCYTNSNVLQTYRGLVFDKTIADGIYEYTVYIKSLKYLAHIKCDKNIEIFSEVECRVFVFHDKVAVRDKIALCII
jgi:exoribonuclease R